MKHRAKNARCYTAIMFVIETSNRQAGMVQPRAAAALLGRFLWSCSKKASQTPKGKPLGTVSHDPATTQPGTVSHRAERTCVSAQPSSADACNVGIRCSDDVMLQHIPRKGRQGRRPLQSVCAAQPTQRLPPVSGTRSDFVPAREVRFSGREEERCNERAFGLVRKRGIWNPRRRGRRCTSTL